MHPIERLRYVARAGDAPDRFLVSEAAASLAAFAREPNALLVAQRQLISRRPESPGLLCLAAHMAHAPDAVGAGYEFATSLEFDKTMEVAEVLAVAEAGGTDVIDSIASGPGQVLCPAGTTAWVDHARSSGRSVVVVMPRGTRLPKLLWASYLKRNGGDAAGELLAIDAFDDLVLDSGVQPISAWTPDAPDAAEFARV